MHIILRATVRLRLCRANYVLEAKERLGWSICDSPQVIVPSNDGRLHPDTLAFITIILSKQLLFRVSLYAKSKARRELRDTTELLCHVCHPTIV